VVVRRRRRVLTGTTSIHQGYCIGDIACEQEQDQFGRWEKLECGVAGHDRMGASFRAERAKPWLLIVRPPRQRPRRHCALLLVSCPPPILRWSWPPVLSPWRQTAWGSRCWPGACSI